EGRGRHARPRHAAGRWALLAREAVSEQSTGNDADVERFARQLLRRWGVVFRDLLARETLAPPWRDLLIALRRLEARGDVRGGRFVSGFLGEQFAMPEAVESLRDIRRSAPMLSLTVGAADPLNLAGIITPGPRVSALAGRAVEIVTAD